MQRFLQIQCTRYKKYLYQDDIDVVLDIFESYFLVCGMSLAMEKIQAFSNSPPYPCSFYASVCLSKVRLTRHISTRNPLETAEPSTKISKMFHPGIFYEILLRNDKNSAKDKCCDAVFPFLMTIDLFLYKQSIFDNCPENCLSFSKKSLQKIVSQLFSRWSINFYCLNIQTF